MTLLTDELKSWIGREAHYPAREEFGRASIRYFALAMRDDNPLYIDDDYAKEAGYASATQPATAALATEIRTRCRHILRNPDGYEIWADY